MILTRGRRRCRAKQRRLVDGVIAHNSHLSSEQTDGATLIRQALDPKLHSELIDLLTVPPPSPVNGLARRR